MARADIPLSSIALGGSAQLSGTNADQANGMQFDNPGDVILVIKNGDGSSRTVTIASVAQPPLGRTGDIARAIAAGEVGVIGPLRIDAFNQSNGKVNVDFSVGTTTAVKITALRVNY